jgi:hypothetical protein
VKEVGGNRGTEGANMVERKGKMKKGIEGGGDIGAVGKRRKKIGKGARLGSGR